VAANATRTVDAYAAQHDGLAPVLVFADANGSFNGDTECVDGPRGRAETYLTRDVHDDIVSMFGTYADPDHWAVVGLSEGGTCAITLGLRHPDVFHTVVDLSGDLGPNLGDLQTTIRLLFGGDASQAAAHNPVDLMHLHRYPMLAIWFEAGLQDSGTLSVARTLAAAAQADGINSRLVAKPGGHNFRFWSSAWQDACPWTMGQVGLPV
jgi:S-formylglutathione hydrolase FrmB